MTETTTPYAGRVKYDEQRARKYQQKKPAKDRAEMRLIDRAFTLVPKHHRVLDAPCGGGRVTVHLAKKGYRVCAADLSDAMLDVTRETLEKHGLTGTVEKQDVECFTFPDKHFDTVISFRLFHHFPTAEVRRRVVKELCRVASRQVVLSYFAPSLSNLRRALREARIKKISKKYTTPLAEVEGYFTEAGFRLVKDYAQLPLFHTLHLAVFERSERKR